MLVVEDDHRIAQSLKKGLEQERYAVDLAFTGTQGYDLVSSEEFDVLIVDIMVPELNGLELCHRLRQEHNHTPILLLTAKSQISDRVTGLDAGADDYLTKPFSFEELLARLRALIRRPHHMQQPILTVGELSLNPSTFVVKRQNKTIELSRKEFALLEYLMRNAGTILSKEKIIAHVWDYDADILPNTVEVYMRALRKKLETPFPKQPPLITTARGFGYTLKKS